MRTFILSLILQTSLLGCTGKSSDGGGSDSNDSIAPVASKERVSASVAYFQQSSVIDLQIWYQTGAEPYVRESILDRDIWNILRGNLASIFQFRATPPAIQVPSDLSAMNKIAAASQENWSTQQIVDLWKANQNGAVPAGTSRFFVYFLDGYLNRDGVSQKNVIGVQIGDYPLIAIFKPVISASTQGALLVPKYMEQSTLVHEMGHALGFVNHGVPMATDHQDEEHGAHTLDEACVMFWLNEGASELQKYVQRFLTTESPILWGQNVLDDAKAISR